MRGSALGFVLLGASCGGPSCPPEVCLALCAEVAPRAEVTNADARALSPHEHAMLGERLLEVRSGLRAPTPQGMLHICAEVPCPEGASRPLEPRLPAGTTFVSVHLLVPKEGAWPVRYTRTCAADERDPLPAWAAPVERALELRGDVGGAASVNLVDRFDVPAGSRSLPCRVEVTDPTPGGAGLLFGRDVIVPG